MYRYFLTVSALALIAGTPALAGGDFDVSEPLGAPAVSASNGKISVFGGGDDGGDDGGGGGLIYGEGSFSMPVARAFGLQVDGLVGHVGTVDDTVAQGAAHLFWRDPGKGLLGLYGSALTVDSSDMYRIAGEGQLYLNRISLEGMIGWDEADDNSDIYWSGTIGFYASENTRIFGGARHSEWRDGTIQGAGTVGFVGLEHQMNWSDDRRGYSLFGEARFGENDYRAVWGGLRVYFGQNKSLKRRHREDDPFTVIPDLVEIVTKAVPVVTPTPPMAPPPPPATTAPPPQSPK